MYSRSILSFGIVTFSLTGLSAPALTAFAASRSTTSRPSDVSMLDSPQIAQVVLPQENLPPSQQPLPDIDLPSPLPAPEDLLRPEQPTPETPLPVPGEVPETIVVESFQVVGSTVFGDADFAVITAPYTQRPLTFDELFEVRSQITALYEDAGYVTSAAILPPQVLTDGVVTIQVIEGTLESIVVQGTEDLKPIYVSSRIEPYVTPPLNIDRLLEGLQLLQLDPLIRRVAAELAAGPQAGTSLLTLTVEEADSGSLSLELNNFRSPSVGSFQQVLELEENNFTGLGDRFRVAASNSQGSRSLQLGYRTYVNPQYGTVEFTLGGSVGEVVEGNLELLDIESSSVFGEVTWRNPFNRTPNSENAVGLTYTRQQSDAVFLESLFGEAVPFPSLGADDDGRTTVSALRLFYEGTHQNEREVFAWRTQLSMGLGTFLGGTVLENFGGDQLLGFDEPRPDNEFLALQGQAQWVRLLAPNTLLVLNGELQFASDALVPAEQFRLGGANGVRGYRQDLSLTDNGFLATAEVRLPIYRHPVRSYQLQITPFLEFGAGWNTRNPTPANNVLASIGTGLVWQQPNLIARIDWGIPLNSVDRLGDSLQENGLYFSLEYRPTF